MIRDAFSYPVDSDNFVKNVLITFTSVLFFPLAPLAYGYLTKIMRSKGRDGDFPKYGNWASLYITGLKFLLVPLVYSLLLIIPAYLLNSTNIGALSLLYGIYGLIMLFALPAIFREFSENESIVEAFNPANLDYVLSWHYLKIYISLWIAFALITLGKIILAVTIVGILIVPFTYAYELMVYSSLVGEARHE